jgi:predicted esterase
MKVVWKANHCRWLHASLLFAITSQVCVAQDDVADIRSKKFTLDPQELQYYLIAGAEKRSVPDDGYNVLIVLPGGDGSADFLPFVKRISKHALDHDYLVIQLLAPKWSENQQVVWPTARDKMRGQKASVEEFVTAAVDDLKTRTRVNDRHVFTLSWSSGGPAAYAASLRRDTPVTGSFVAMSVFKANQLPALRNAKDRAYYILHSPDDMVCPYRMAVTARDTLREAGARVEFAEYEGGHGWHGDPFGNIRRGIDWLEQQAKQ